MTGQHDTPTDTGSPDPSNAALNDLRELIDTGGWRRLLGPPDTLIFIHPYADGSVDTLAVKGETDALAERTNPEGTPVWHRDGQLSEIIGLLRTLPHPLTPGAPRTVIGGGMVARLSPCADTAEGDLPSVLDAECHLPLHRHRAGVPGLGASGES